MDIIDCQDSRDLEESFSFSCYDLNSTTDHPEILSSDDDDDNDDESCFEIALQQPTQHAAEEFDFRISFSDQFTSQTQSLARVHNLKNSQADKSCSSLDSSSSTDIFSVNTDISTTETPTSELSTPREVTKGRKLQFPALNRNANLFLWSLRRASESGGEENGRPDENRQSMVKNIDKPPELIGNRKASKITTIINGGIMKFLIKFRSVKVRSTLVSFIKPYQPVTAARQSNINTRKNNKGTNKILTSKGKRLVQKVGVGGKNNNSINTEKRDKSRSVINVDAIRGVLEAAVSRLSLGPKVKEAKSSPSSITITSSPIHRGGGAVSENFKNNDSRENPVQAAIAHCKSTFGGAN